MKCLRGLRIRILEVRLELLNWRITRMEAKFEKLAHRMLNLMP